MAGPVITWDYLFSPNGWKVRNHLNVAGIPYQICEQPLVLPRPILNDLGITYRRIPLLSIGKDFFCDSSLNMDALQKIFKEKALPTSPADKAYESLGYRLFPMAIPTVPAKMVTTDFVKDRESLFPVMKRPDFASLRPSALGEMKNIFSIIENEFIGEKGPWIGGDKCSIADIHILSIVKWAVEMIALGEEPGFGRESFPRVYKWIESLPPYDEAHEAEKISGDKAKEIVLSSQYGAKDIGVDSKDPTGLKAGEQVTVEPTDLAIQGLNPQHGKLVGLSIDEIVLELENSIRVHFPRIGYCLKKA